MTPAEVLDAAADLIERDGWVQGRAHTAKGSCAFGAISRVTPDRTAKARLDAFEALARHVGQGGDFPIGEIARWNDADECTATEVIETLRKCAAEARWTEDAS